MKPPCVNCITLPMCGCRFISFFDSLKSLNMNVELRVFHTLLNLKGQCELIGEYISRSLPSTLYNERVDRLHNFYIYTLNLPEKIRHEHSVYKLYHLASVQTNSKNQEG